MFSLAGIGCESIVGAKKTHTTRHVDGQNFTALVSRATTVRQKGRLCMVLRSCANIIVRQRPSEIEAVKAEAKRLKIAIPKQMLLLLSRLEHGDAAQEQAEDE